MCNCSAQILAFGVLSLRWNCKYWRAHSNWKHLSGLDLHDVGEFGTSSHRPLMYILGSGVDYWSNDRGIAPEHLLEETDHTLRLKDFASFIYVRVRITAYVWKISLVVYMSGYKPHLKTERFRLLYSQDTNHTLRMKDFACCIVRVQITPSDWKMSLVACKYKGRAG